MTFGLGIAIFDSGEFEKSSGGTGSNQSSTLGGGNKTNGNGTALSSHLGGNSVGSSDLGTPMSSSDGNEGEFGQNDGGADGVSDFFRGLNSQSDVSVVVSNDDEGLETGALTGTGLLLNGHDLHHFFFQVILLGVEGINDFIFLDRKRMLIDFLERGNVTGLNEATELGNGSP